jgi:hypothetical protein
MLYLAAFFIYRPNHRLFFSILEPPLTATDLFNLMKKMVHPVYLN